MSDSESEDYIQSRCSDDELGHLGQSRASNESIKQPYTTVWMILAKFKLIFVAAHNNSKHMD